MEKFIKNELFKSTIRTSNKDFLKKILEHQNLDISGSFN